MKKENLRMKELFELPGISGRESLISDYLSKIFKENNFTIEFDNLGSIIATKKSKKPSAKKLLIDAHMDEVGFMATNLTSNGLIQFESHGYVNKNSLLNQRVRVYKNDLLSFVIGAISYKIEIDSPELLDKIPNIDKMYIDVGARSKEELEKNFGLKIGASIVFDSPTIFNGNRVIGKAIDDRAGISLLLDLADYFKNIELDFDLILVGSVQEEVGVRGARTAFSKIKPDLVIVVDTSPANDFPTSNDEGDLGKGTFLRHKDALHIPLKNTISFLEKVLIDNDITYQDYFSNGGTNAYAYSLIEGGAPILPMGFLVRNIHSGSIIFDLDDYRNTQKLLIATIKTLNQDLSLD